MNFKPTPLPPIEFWWDTPECAPLPEDESLSLISRRRIRHKEKHKLKKWGFAVLTSSGDVWDGKFFQSRNKADDACKKLRIISEIWECGVSSMTARVVRCCLTPKSLLLLEEM